MVDLVLEFWSLAESAGWPSAVKRPMKIDLPKFYNCKNELVVYRLLIVSATFHKEPGVNFAS